MIASLRAKHLAYALGHSPFNSHFKLRSPLTAQHAFLLQNDELLATIALLPVSGVCDNTIWSRSLNLSTAPEWPQSPLKCFFKSLPGSLPAWRLEHLKPKIWSPMPCSMPLYLLCGDLIGIALPIMISVGQASSDNLHASNQNLCLLIWSPG